MNKILFLILLVTLFLLALFLGYFFLYNKYPYNYWSCVNGEYQRHGFPLSNPPIGGCGGTLEYPL